MRWKTMDENLRKIVYFDKETIKNILQEKHRGRRTSESIETKETANYHILLMTVI